MNEVRIGIIGVGNMGSGHCHMIINGDVPGLTLAAVADLRPERRAWAKETLPESVRVFPSGNELIDSDICDAVLVAVPHYQHPALVMRALARGQHALCEKPAGVYCKQVREMNEAAARSDKTFAMMFNQRTNPLYIKAREMVRSGDYGALKRVSWIITDWYRTQAYYDSGMWRATWAGEGGGVLLNQCPHNLDLLQWICGLPTRVRAFCHNGKWHDIEVEDDVTAYLEFENGATGVFVTTTGDAPGTNRLEITLERAKLVCENGQMTCYELNMNEREYCKTATEGFKQPEGRFVPVDVSGDNPQHAGVLRAFAGRILRGEPLVAGGEEGIRGLQLSNAMHLSSWLDRAVDLPVDEDLFLRLLNERRAASRLKTDVREITFTTEGTYGTPKKEDAP